MSRRKREVGALGAANFGFIIADILDLWKWSQNNSLSMEYFPDPEYFMFEKEPQAKEYELDIIRVSMWKSKAQIIVERRDCDKMKE